MQPALGRALCLAVLALAAGCDTPRSEMTVREFAVAAGMLAATAADGELLVMQLAGDRVTREFAFVHQESLSRESLDVADELAKAAPPALREPLGRLVRMNAELQGVVHRVAQSRASPQDLEELRSTFHRIASEARRLGQAA